MEMKKGEIVRIEPAEGRSWLLLVMWMRNLLRKGEYDEKVWTNENARVGRGASGVCQ